jgi:hypothetical protein
LRKTNILYGLCKKDKKNIPWIVILEHQKLSFLHGTQKCSFFPENLHANIEYLHVYALFYFRIFWYFKMCFHENGFICTHESKWIFRWTAASNIMNALQQRMVDFQNSRICFMLPRDFNPNSKITYACPGSLIVIFKRLRNAALPLV